MEACITPTLVKLVEDEPPRIHPTAPGLPVGWKAYFAFGLEGLVCLLDVWTAARRSSSSLPVSGGAARSRGGAS